MPLLDLKLPVKVATVDDEPNFRVLVRAYLREIRSQGSEIQPTDRTVDFYCGLFTRYCDTPTNGVTVMAGEVGFSMAGDATLPLDSDFGRTAIGWGTYVDPSCRGFRVADRLRRRLRDELRKRDFQTVLGGVHKHNLTAFNSVQRTNWTPYQVLGFDDLRREG